MEKVINETNHALYNTQHDFRLSGCYLEVESPHKMLNCDIKTGLVDPFHGVTLLP